MEKRTQTGSVLAFYCRAGGDCIFPLLALGGPHCPSQLTSMEKNWRTGNEGGRGKGTQLQRERVTSPGRRIPETTAASVLIEV